jgi:hypothetical protein
VTTIRYTAMGVFHDRRCRGEWGGDYLLEVAKHSYVLIPSAAARLVRRVRARS